LLKEVSEPEERMATFHWALVFGGLVSFGCHIQHNEGGDGSIFDDEESCSSSKKNETSSDAGPDAPISCSVHAECPAMSYCDAELGRCLPSASCKSDVDCACADDASCIAQQSCDLERATCTPLEPPTCDEIKTEAECSARPECESIYAGVGCSCGPDCECKGGEPGCVCESFEFFRCAAPDA
jgi:hypothetical protein